jgi:hypothetical protein
MPDDIRINLHLPLAAEAVIKRLCEERGVARTTLVRQALGMLQVAHDAAAQGHYVGTTRVREHLDQVIVAPL